MDDTIDEKDIAYVEGVIKGTNEATNLSDANFDGKIDDKDITQIEQIIAGTESSLTIVDDSPEQRNVTVAHPVESVAVLGTYGAEAMRSLKADDKVSCVSDPIVKDYNMFLPEFSKLPTIGGMFSPDLEKLVAQNPNLVLAYAESPKPEEFDSKLPSSINVVHLDFTRADLMCDDFKKLGYIVDRTEEADEIIKFYEDFNIKIKEKTENLPVDGRPRVYLASMGFSSSKIYNSIGKGTGPDSACDMAGGINIAEHSGYKDVDPEWVTSQNPDIIVAVLSTSSGIGYEYDNTSLVEAMRNEILNSPELAEVKAVKEGKVYCISLQIMSKPRYFLGVAYLAKWLHPDLFEDLNPEKLNAEYLERFQDLPYRGVYIYPPLNES
jgi:iron complex transport system substrate-binding protein